MRNRQGSLPGAIALCLTPLTVPGCVEGPTALQGVEYASFVALPALADVGAEGIRPATDVLHWQLRFSWDDDRPDEILLIGGSLGLDGLPESIRSDLAATRASEDGFARNFGCAPAGCHHYIVSADSASVALWDSPADLLAFLGSIDFESEAILLLAGEGYHWRPGDRSTGAIRALETGFEAIALEIISPCNPHLVHRHILRVRRSGAVDRIDSETWFRDPDSCI